MRKSILTFSLMVAACNDSSSPQVLKGPQPVDPPTTGIESCSQNPYEGKSISFKNIENFSTDSGYFGKLFSSQRFKQSLAASSYSIAENLKAEGVQLFSVTVPSTTQCRYFNFLKGPSAEAKQNWKKAGGFDPGDSVLLGLFTTYYQPISEKKFQLYQPTIMVRHDTQKWTLVHEMSHYLFAKGRTEGEMLKTSYLENIVDSSFEKAQTALENFKDESSEQNLMKVARHYHQFFKANLELDKLGPLEEFSIESMLIDEILSQNLSGVNLSEDSTNAFNYMDSNAELVFPSYSQFLDKLRMLNELAENDWEQVKPKILQIMDEVSITLEFVLEKLNQAEQVAKQYRQGSDRLKPDIHFHHFDVEKVKSRHKLFEKM